MVGMKASFKDQRQRRHEEQPEANPEAVRALSDTHPAILEERTIFPSTVVTAGN